MPQKSFTKPRDIEEKPQVAKFEDDPFFHENVPTGGPSPSLAMKRADSRDQGKLGFQKVSKPSESKDSLNYMYSPGVFTRQRSNKMLENFQAVKEEEREIAISPLLNSVSPLVRNGDGISPLGRPRGGVISPLIRTGGLAKGAYSRQRSTLLNQDNVVLATPGQSDDNHFKEPKPANDGKSQPNEDFSNDFMTMLGQGALKATEVKKELQP